MWCEKCWRDANRRFFLNPSKSITEYYHELLKERKDNPCTRGLHSKENDSIDFTKSNSKTYRGNKKAMNWDEAKTVLSDIPYQRTRDMSSFSAYEYAKMLDLAEFLNGEVKKITRIYEETNAECGALVMAHEARIDILNGEVERLKAALSELHAVVKGEAPQLLDGDSGGDAQLDIQIEALLKKEVE